MTSKMHFHWNHWFWITVGVLVCVNIEASEKLNTFLEDEGPIALPAGARGGKALLHLPTSPQHFTNDVVNRFDLELGPTHRPPFVLPPSAASVSVSKSVSKVSVMRKVSVSSSTSEDGGSNSEQDSGLQSLAKISDIYVDRGIRNNRPLPQVPGGGIGLAGRQPRPRRIQPYYIGYNLVYREPEMHKKPLYTPASPANLVPSLRRLHPSQPPTPPANLNVGLLSTIIAKLKSLAEATSSRIRFSNLLKEPVLLTTESGSDATSTLKPAETSTTTSTTTSHPDTEEETSANTDEHQGKPSAGHVLVRIDDLGVTTDEEAQIFNTLDEEPAERPRSLEARGRSLPFLDTPAEPASNSISHGGDLPSQDWEDGDATLMAQENYQAEQDVLQEVVKEIQEERVIEDVINEVEEIAGNSAGDNVNNEPLIQQGDFIEDFTAPEYAFAGEDVKISAERIDQSNISAVIGVILGIIIFVIISIVLVLLGVQRRHIKNVKSTEPAEDVISQASYMTYSTTVSDHSVNYGPANWEKDICEDLCSLDNDSFLNSLEAVTTTDHYWGNDHY